MGIKDLPRPGINFRATYGPGNFQKKLNTATRYGDLKNLRDNREAIVKAIKGSERDIRIKGGLSRLKRLSVWRSIKASDKAITKGDKLEIKKILEHLGRGAARLDKQPVLKEGDKIISVGGEKRLITKEQIERNLRGRMALDETALEESGRRTDVNVLGQVGGGVRGSAARLGVGAPRSTGFAQNYQRNKPSSGGPPPKMPGGVKPLGFK